MAVYVKPRYLYNIRVDSLENYVGSRSSKEINQNLKNMEYTEIVEFKESLETIIRFISTRTLYH